MKKVICFNNKKSIIFYLIRNSVLRLIPENHDFHFKTYSVVDHRQGCLPNAAEYGNVSLMRQKYLGHVYLPNGTCIYH